MVLGRPEAGRVAAPRRQQARHRDVPVQLGRRDSALFLWLVFALVGLLVLVLIMAAIIALAWFVASVVQLVVAPAPASR